MIELVAYSTAFTAVVCACVTIHISKRKYDQGFEEGRAEGILDGLTGDWVEIEEGVWMKKTDKHIYREGDEDE